MARRYQNVSEAKADGATYTPANLARFVAQQIVKYATLPSAGPIRLLDPAVGDGVLLDAMLEALSPAMRSRIEVVAFDTDHRALAAAQARILRNYPSVVVTGMAANFLESGPSTGESTNADDLFDIVIANPPYVRTQVMGSDCAQRLSTRFGLTGRVDLYHAFVLAIGRSLRKSGTAGIITSNRFLSTRSGQQMRLALAVGFRLHHIWDLGDTRLFDAAVLPAVLVFQRRRQATASHSKKTLFSTIYETDEPTTALAPDVLTALEAPNDAIRAIPNGKRFRIQHGTLDAGHSVACVWRVSTAGVDKWLSTVGSHTWNTFRRIGKIRVGVKTTADHVFIRSDWESLEGGVPELLHPLITRHSARRFRSIVPVDLRNQKRILYPHACVAGKRVAVDLTKFPKALSYLEQHRSSLEARRYVADAGRRWYEIWVPHDPASWKAPKVVFPDISDRPTFWMDMGGGIVNGECYWLSCADEGDIDLLWLALAISNSTFIETFYDRRFNNRLYAGRRRFITQYVEQFPLPDPTSSGARRLIQKTKDVFAALPSAEADRISSEIDNDVWKLFGLVREETSGERNL